MTDQSELDRQTDGFASRRAENRGPAPISGRGASADAIRSGLEFLFSCRQHQHWSLCAPFKGESAAWVTAYVLVRLGEIPAECFSYSQRRQMSDSLDWLMESRTSEGGWSFGPIGSPADADSTAWAVTAVRQHGRPVPHEALELIRRCRCSDGGFAVDPETASTSSLLSASAPDVTAIAVRALAYIDASSSEFLASNLRTDLLGTPCRLGSRFFVSSTLLDWEPGMAPWFVVSAVRQLACEYPGEGAWEQALLLRCMMRLRMQASWALMANLRRMQQMDGSWPGSSLLVSLARVPANQSGPHFDEQGVLATATALSALAAGDLQPGLYFGSDLPFRRL